MFFPTVIRVSSRGGQGGGEASPKNSQLPPPPKRKRVGREKKGERREEREREVGEHIYDLSILILHVNSIPPKTR